MTGLRIFSALSAFGLVAALVAQPTPGAAAPAAQPAQAQPAQAQPAGQPAPVAPSGVQPEAARVLEAATKALADANSLSFKVVTTMPKFQGAGMDVQANFEANVEMLRRPDGTGWMTRREGTANMGASTPFLVVSDGQMVSWIDHDKKTVFEKTTRAARDKQITSADSASIKQLTDAQPFAKELAAPKATIEGTATADGTPCDIVAVNFGENKAALRWFIGAADRLPRRLESAIGPFATVYELTNVKVNPEISADRFTLATPEGYKRDAMAKPIVRSGSPGADNPPVIPPKARPTPGDQDGPPALRTAPAFELRTIDGKTVSLASLKGNVAVLGFWGSWHRGGRLAAPELQALADRYKGKPVKVYWLALKGKDEQGIQDFLKQTGLTVGTLTDADATAKDYQVRSYPGFVVVGFDGEVLHQTGGFVAKETMGEMQKAIDSYLEGGPGAGGDAAKPGAPGTGNTPGGPRTLPGVNPATSKPAGPAKPAKTEPK